MNLTEDITTAVQFAEAEWGIAAEPISAGTIGEMAWVCVDTGEATPIVILDAKPYAVATPIGLDLTTEWRSDGPTSLTAGGGPSQARAPKGTPIGGEWIDTPGGLLTAVSTGGGAGQESAPTGVQKIVREQGGASLDPVTLEQPTDGFMVAVQGHNREVPEDEFFGPGGEDALHSWIADNQAPLSEPGAHIGLWHDTEHGEVVLDVSQNVKDRDEAIRLGQERNQQSIWDVVNGEEIPTGGTGDRQASAYRMEHHDRSDPDGADSGSALRHTLERGGSTWVLHLGRGAPAGVRPLGDQRAPAPRLTALLDTYRSGDAKQARAPKGSPGGIGGQWIDTIRGILVGLSGGSPSPLVESKEPLPRLFGDHSPVPADGADKNGKPYGADVVDAANTVYARSADREPVVTRDITDVLTDGGLEPYDLAFRLKTPDSLARKIRDDLPAKGTVDAAASGMFDVIRYTGVAQSETYAQSSAGALADLRARGYQPVKVKNFWEDPSTPYNGINTQLLGPQGEQIELQFHTPESKAAALKMHPMFEDYRLMEDKTAPEATALWDEMHAIAATVPKPPEVETVH